MAAYNFRTAFNGFHREDVVHYIEYINAKNTAQLNQLRADLAAAKEEADRLSAQPERAGALEEQIASLTGEAQQLRLELEAARQANDRLEQELAQVRQERDQALERHVEVQRHTDQELEAYRRAERMERQAKERSEAMFHRANGVIADVTAQVDQAADHIGAIADQVVAQLGILQEAVAGSKEALKTASASLFAIHPED